MKEGVNGNSHEGEIRSCDRVHTWNIEPGDGFDAELGHAIRHMVTSEHSKNGNTFGGYSGEDISAERLGIGFFQKAGLLPYLAKRFHGRVVDALNFAFSQVPEGETVEVVTKIPIPEYLRNGDGPEKVKTVDKSSYPDSDGLTCQHHWLIETPRGTFSKGTCKMCGNERDFRNSANDALWEDDGQRGSNWRGMRGKITAPVLDDFD